VVVSGLQLCGKSAVGAASGSVPGACTAGLRVGLYGELYGEVVMRVSRVKHCRQVWLCGHVSTVLQAQTEVCLPCITCGAEGSAC
jgi:hypothetical protein